LPKGSLEKVLEQQSLTFAQKKTVMRDIAAGLSFIHSKKVTIFFLFFFSLSFSFFFPFLFC
jgi:serine/threonine protein kinase